MAQAPQEGGSAFLTWFVSVCEKEKIEPRWLRSAYYKHDGQADPRTLRRWMAGGNPPKGDDEIILVKALIQLLPDRKVGEEYLALKRGLLFGSAPEDGAGGSRKSDKRVYRIAA